MIDAVREACLLRFRPILMTTLAAALGRVFERTPDIKFGEPRAGDIRESLGNPAEVERQLGFRQHDYQSTACGAIPDMG